MAIYTPESFYSTTLASAITASQNTIPVTTAPTITSGYLVLEAGNSTNREIILYTGVSGTTLTGVTRGLSTTASAPTAGTGKAHAAGVDISNRDVHYYFSQYYDFLVGVSATGSNAMRIGDGNTISASNRLWYAQTSSLSAFWGLSASGQMVVSEDGVTSYVISAGGSGVTAGTSIDITAGAVSVTKLSTGGLTTSAGRLAVGVSSLLARDANGLRVDTTSAMEWSGAQTWNGASTFASSATFSSAATFDGSVYGVDKSLSKFIAAEAITAGDVVSIHVVSANATDDAYTVNGDAAGNYSTQDYISIYANAGTRYNGYVSWSVSSLPLSASKAYMVLSANATAPGTMTVKRLSTNWVEGTITWNNGPTAGTDIYGTPASLIDGTNVYDITATYNGWKNGDYTNCGLLLYSETVNGDTYSINSSESSSQPKLWVLSNKVSKAIATNIYRTSSVLGIAVNTVSANQDVYVATDGKVTNASWNIYGGTVYYLSDTGTLATTAGTYTKQIGIGAPNFDRTSGTDTLIMRIT